MSTRQRAARERKSGRYARDDKLRSANGRRDHGEGRGRRRRWISNRTRSAMRAPAESRRESQTEAVREATKD